MAQKGEHAVGAAHISRTGDNKVGPSTAQVSFDFRNPTQMPCNLDEGTLSDLCASFQQAIIDVLVAKALAAARKYGVDLVTVSGGVSCNQELRRQLREACRRKGIEFKSAEPWLCTDNAAMIAFAALLRLQAGCQSQLTGEIDPNLPLV